MNVQGVVLCNQPRVLDLQKRGGSFIEKAPPEIIDEVRAKVSTLLE
jgi:mRNA-degrading endonuclease toxin of MazEF toxin-antitoxin module